MFTGILLPAQSDSISRTDVELLADTIELISHPLNNYLSLDSDRLIVGRESRELAASFEDPSRVLYRAPGISLDNDQNNSISYRGLPGEYMRWSVSGAEIVNPNHLSNAGRLSDESSLSAGGVLGIPFDVIRFLDFSGNPYDNTRVSSMSGVANFDFESQSDNFFKLGLLGFEAGIQTQGRMATKAHARYSTVGLLSDLGVDFDGEQIRFYDIFLRTALAENWRFSFSAGRSSNRGAAALSADTVENYEDLFNIDFNSSYLFTGLEYKQGHGQHALYYSRNNNERDSELVWPSQAMGAGFEERTDRQGSEALSYVTRYTFTGKHVVWNYGSRLGYLNHRFRRQENRLSGEELYVSGYAIWTKAWQWENGFAVLKPGLEVYYILNHDNKARMQPSFSLDIATGPHHFQVDFANRHRRETYTSFDTKGWSIPLTNRNLSYSLAYKWKDIPSEFIFMTRVYRMEFWHSHHALQNYFYRGMPYNDILDDPGIWSSMEKTVSRGLELSIDKNWSKGFYTHANYSLLDARNVSAGLDAANDFGFIFNAIISKSFLFKNGKSLAANMAFHARGGAVQYIFENEALRLIRLGDYKRLDLRLQYGNEKHIWTLDIQNIAGFTNPAYLYYDALLDREFTENQLGMIPLLSYKRVF